MKVHYPISESLICAALDLDLGIVIDPQYGWKWKDEDNYQEGIQEGGTWYTITLNAMFGTTPILSDTVRVMPIDKFIYLPLVLRGF